MKTKIKKNIALISVSFITFIIGFVLSYVVIKWGNLKDTFWDISLSVLVELLVTIIIALFITYYVSQKTGDDSKRKEITLELFIELRSTIERTLKAILQYTNCPSEENANLVNYEFKSAIHQMDDIKNLKEKNIIAQFCYCDKFENRFLKYKSSATDDPFQNKKAKYSDLRVQEIYTAYHDLRGEIDSIRFGLYE